MAQGGEGSEVGRGPEAHSQPSRVGRTQGGGLSNLGSYDGDTQDISLELHKEFVVDHPTVHFERL